MELNPTQQKVVDHADGNLLVVAGPGTGKTHTITHKIAAVLNRDPKLSLKNIFVITFTNKAADQLKERLLKLHNDASRMPFIGTFHSLSYSLLQHGYETLGISSRPDIIPEKEKKDLIKTIALGLDPSIKAKKIRDFEGLISSMKNRLISSRELAEKEPESLFADVYAHYEKIMLERNLMDFDDLLLRMVRMLQAHPDIKKAINESLRWLFIDEYQDINEAQYQLIRMIVSPETNVCAIGDPDQAIYGFRGSDVLYFLQFERDFPPTTIMTLEESFRSSPQILELANTLIAHNRNRVHKNLSAVKPSGPRILVTTLEDHWKEAAYIAREIGKLVGGTDINQAHELRGADQGDKNSLIPDFDPAKKSYFFSDIAVLYRTRMQGKILREVFQKHGIPCQTLSTDPWFQAPEIVLLLNCFRFFLDPAHKTGDPDTDFLCSHVGQAFQTMRDLKAAAIAQKIIELLHLDESPSLTPSQLGRRAKNLEQFISSLHQFDALTGSDALEEAVRYFSLLDEQDLYDERLQAVSLMTIHASKGLEFDAVFVAGLEDGVLPLTSDSDEELEEERRLFYVAVTRARERLCLVRSKKRNQREMPISPFLLEIGSGAEHRELKPRKTRSIVNESQMSFF